MPKLKKKNPTLHPNFSGRYMGALVWALKQGTSYVPLVYTL